MPIGKLFRNRSLLRWVFSLTGLLFMFVPSFVAAQGSSSIAQSFQTTDSNIVVGALVNLQSDSANSVELSTTDHTDRLLGVVGDQALIELSDGSQANVQVVTSGIAYALVTDINGEVKTGDRIAPSPIAGVGMKTTQSGVIVGVAQSDLANTETTSKTVKDKSGKSQSVKIGLIPVQIDVVFYTGTKTNNFVPSFVQNLANSVAGRNVSPLRVLSAAILLLLLFVSVVAVLYSAVRSSIISIGRNPLSEGAVHKSLLQVGVTVLGLLAFTTILVYLILTV